MSSRAPAALPSEPFLLDPDHAPVVRGEAPLKVTFWTWRIVSAVIAMVVALGIIVTLAATGWTKPAMRYTVLLSVPVLPVFLWLWWIKEGRRQLNRTRLGSSHTLLPATVVSSNGYAEESVFRVVVKYRFQTPDGRTVTAEDKAMRHDLRDKPLPGPGHPLVVAYHDPESFMLL